MAVFDTSRALNEGVRYNPTTPLSAILAAVIAWNDRRMTRKTLSKLTARELEDIGLTRGDIADI